MTSSNTNPSVGRPQPTMNPPVGARHRLSERAQENSGDQDNPLSQRDEPDQERGAGGGGHNNPKHDSVRNYKAGQGELLGSTRNDKTMTSSNTNPPVGRPQPTNTNPPIGTSHHRSERAQENSGDQDDPPSQRDELDQERGGGGGDNNPKHDGVGNYKAGQGELLESIRNGKTMTSSDTNLSVGRPQPTNMNPPVGTGHRRRERAQENSGDQDNSSSRRDELDQERGGGVSDNSPKHGGVPDGEAGQGELLGSTRNGETMTSNTDPPVGRPQPTNTNPSSGRPRPTNTNPALGRPQPTNTNPPVGTNPTKSHNGE
jgi:hypothetical protein